MKTPRRLAMFATLGLGVAALAPTHAYAQQGPSDTNSVSSTVQVVAEGLNAPRGLVYDAENHRVLVAEAGVLAGDTGPCGSAERGLPFCFGNTGSIFQYSLNGTSGRIVTGLPSAGIPPADDPGESVVIGLHDLSLFQGKLTGVFGLLGNQAYRDSLGPDAANMARAVTFTGSGQVQPFADLIAFEDQLYADKPEGDPYGVLTGSFGALVVNAGGPHSGTTEEGNDLLLVRHNGSIVQLAQFPDRPSPIDPTRQIESVPTRVAQGPDGAFYVGELTGAPFQVGVARIWRVVPGHQPTVYADGLTVTSGVTFDEQGRLVVLEMTTDPSPDPFNPNQTGALIRFEPNGQRTVLASNGLNNAGGVAYAGHGIYYVTTRTAGFDGTGQLVKVQVDG